MTACGRGSIVMAGFHCVIWSELSLQPRTAWREVFARASGFRAKGLVLIGATSVCRRLVTSGSLEARREVSGRIGVDAGPSSIDS